jgi:hypothetical protein
MATMRRYRQLLTRKRARVADANAADWAAEPDSQEQTSTPSLLATELDSGEVRHSTIRLAGRAMAEQWVPDALAIRLVASMSAIAESTQAKTSDRIAAARTVLGSAASSDRARERLASEERRPSAVVNVFDRAQVLLQQLASAPAGPQIAQEAAPAGDPAQGGQEAG